MKSIKVSHIALVIKNLVKARRFYGDVLGLPELERPPFEISGIWYQLGEIELHLAVYEQRPLNYYHPLNETVQIHFALACDDDEFLSLYQRLKLFNVQLIGGIVESPLGNKQLFFYNPDGNMIEINNENSMATLD